MRRPRPGRRRGHPGGRGGRASARSTPRYATDGKTPFYLFHRPRRWNPQQGVWMGWERKRGKLAEFNRFVRGGGSGRVLRASWATSSRSAACATSSPSTPTPCSRPTPRRSWSARWPIRSTARSTTRRSGAWCAATASCSRGSASRCRARTARRFAAIHSGHPGVDPYTTAVSDVYQDLYGEGSFTGKGIYDVDAFEQATHGRFPENTLLSHDLIEGSYARAGLATDIIVYDDYPTRYLTYTRRKHRWIRGDWQLLRWLTARVPGPGRPRAQPALAALALEDPRQPAPQHGRDRAARVPRRRLDRASRLAAPLDAARPRRDRRAVARLAAAGDRSGRRSTSPGAPTTRRLATTRSRAPSRSALAIAFLPHQAWVSADAIVRTLWRLFVTRRSLLEWQTASQTERVVSPGPGAAWRTMWPAVALAARAARHGRGRGPPCERCRLLDLPALAGAALPLLVLWAVSPSIAHAAQRARGAARAPAARRRAGRRRCATRCCTGASSTASSPQATHWLAPDNFQEDPEPVVAMRTSPTNIGLQLLATVSAYDLGFITARGHDRAAGARVPLARSGCGGSAATSTTGTTCATCRCSSRRTSRRWTAATWPATSSRCARPASRSPTSRCSTRGPGARSVPPWALADERLREPSPPSEPPTRRSRRPSSAAERRARKAEAAVAGAETLRPRRCWPELAGRSSGPWPTLRAYRPTSDGGRAGRRLDRMVPRAGAGAGRAAHGPGAAAGRRARLAPDRPIRILALRRSTIRGRGDLVARLESWPTARRYMRWMDFRFLFDESRELFAIGYQPASPLARPLVLRPARVRGAARQLHRDRQERRPGRALVPPGPHAHPRRRGDRAGVVERQHVRVPDAGAGHALVPVHRCWTRPTRGRSSGRSPTARSDGVPWGMSESAYNLRDRHLTYQYRAFGVPDLALKRGLGRDLVIAPYASALAVDGRAAARARQSRHAGEEGRARTATASATRSTTPARDPGQRVRGGARPTWRITSACGSSR